MPEHVHAHMRSDDKPNGIIIPSWAKTAVIALATTIASTVSVLSWFDSRYAKQSDLANMNSQVNEKLDDIKTDVNDIKRYMLRPR